MILLCILGLFNVTYRSSIVEAVKSEYYHAINGKEYFYLPLHTWQNLYTYSPEKIALFNDNPYGAGCMEIADTHL